MLPGCLSAGCGLPFAGYALIAARAFGESAPARRKQKRGKDALNSLTEITPGDLVVHQNHGIGRYAGIRRMEVQGVTKDYLRIEYDKKDVLYVPVTQLDLLSRYTAPGDADKVKLSRLGGGEWNKTAGACAPPPRRWPRSSSSCTPAANRPRARPSRRTIPGRAILSSALPMRRPPTS